MLLEIKFKCHDINQQRRNKTFFWILNANELGEGGNVLEYLIWFA